MLSTLWYYECVCIEHGWSQGITLLILDVLEQQMTN